MTTLHATGLLFDLDGVLVDSNDSVDSHWRTFAEWFDLDADELVKRTHGVPHYATIERELQGRPDEEIKATIERFERLELEDAKNETAMTGAVALVSALPRSNWAVVTSGWRALAEARAGAAGIELPATMVTADQLEHGKPSPEGYSKGAALLGVEPSDCVVFEDSPTGIRAGLAAGCRVVALRTTTPDSELNGATAIVDDLSRVRVEDDFVIHLDS